MDLFSTTDWISTLDILAAAQGIFLAVLLVGRSVNRVANLYLALLMIVFSVDLLSAAYFIEGYDAKWPHLMGVDVVTGVLYGPLLYLYAHALTGMRGAFHRRDLVHFLPCLILLAVLAPFYMQSGEAKLLFRADPYSSGWTGIIEVIGYGKLVYGLVYLVLMFYLLRSHRRQIQTQYSTLDKVNLAWLTRVLIGGFGVWVVAAVAQIVWTWQGPGNDPVEGFGGFVSVFMVILVYSIGYLGLRQPEIFQGVRAASNDLAVVHDGSLLIIDESSEPEGPAVTSVESYSRSGLSEENRDRIHDQLVTVMEEDAPFKDPALTLQQLAKVAGLTVHHVSEAINQSAGKNFYEFVNGYRVEDAKSRLMDPKFDRLTVLAIGMDAGFNSKSTFNSTFKKYTGLTPSAFKQTRQA